MGAYAKAIVGALVAGLTALATGYDDNHLAANEIIMAAVAALTALTVIWAVPNSPPDEV